jgi:hypothetical protein
MQTHQLSLDPEGQVATKRFGAASRGEAEREWRALQLLAEHAPGLAPAPIRADLSGAVPLIEMSLLPGVSLGGAPLTAEQESALVLALGQLWQAVPVERVTLVPGESGNQAQLMAEVTRMLDGAAGRQADPVVGKALASGADWLSWGPVAVAGPAGPRQRDDHQVLGQGDGNLANFLWDGERVRIVDFEDSGPSDRAFELAVLVEHVSAWLEAGLDAARFVAAFGLSRAELERLASWRRLAALFWLLRFEAGGTGQSADRLRAQADRLLGLL